MTEFAPAWLTRAPWLAGDRIVSRVVTRVITRVRTPALAGALVCPVALLTALLVALAPGPAAAQLKSADNPEANPVWQKVRASLFAGRSIENVPDGPDAVVRIDAPARADDAAVVPIALRTKLPPGDTRRVRQLVLVIDNNPSPIAAVFDFARDGGGQAEIETRVRVDEYTHVRAIAEFDDGRLVMATRFIKASGGCSAPPGKDPQAALASLGRMRLRIDGPLQRGQPALAQLMISHPNHSGLAMDQSTRQYTPAHFVRRVLVSYAGALVLSADLDFAISENPNLRFHFVPQGDGELKAEVLDTQDLRFETTLALVPAR